MRDDYLDLVARAELRRKARHAKSIELAYKHGRPELLGVTHLAGFGGRRRGDPYWSSVVLALHMDGTNGSTTFTDLKGHTVTANGNAQISTAQYKFGGASALFDGTGDYLSIADSDDWYWPGDFTIGFWVYPVSFSSTYQRLVGQGNSGSLWSGVALFGSGASWRCNDKDGNYITFSGGSGATLATGSWQYVEFQRGGDVYKISIDCVSVGTFTQAGSPTNYAQSFMIGGDNSYGFNGYLDDILVTKGVARNTSSNPTTAFPNS